MDTILITGGEIPEYRDVKDLFDVDYICVADSGLDWAVANGIEFDHLVGDMDSIKNRKILDDISEEKITLLPTDKDDTDTVYGLRFLKSLGATTITLIGGGGGRIDHLLGIVSLFETNLAPDVWCTHRERIYYINGSFPLKGMQGKSLSIYPLGEVVCSIDSFGLKWNLMDIEWVYKSIGISNVIKSNDAWIDTKENRVLLIIPIEGKGFE